MRTDGRIRTRERILDGAVRAVARHGLSKLGMSDVSDSAGVSRWRLYRYFPTREELLWELTQREALLFYESVMEEADRTPAGEARLDLVLEIASQQLSGHPALQRLLETDPAMVLESIRDRFPDIRERLTRVLGPALRETHPVRSGVISEGQLVDWATRLLISLYLFPDSEPQKMARGLGDMYRLLTAKPALVRKRRSPKQKPTARGMR